MCKRFLFAFCDWSLILTVFASLLHCNFTACWLDSKYVFRVALIKNIFISTLFDKQESSIPDVHFQSVHQTYGMVYDCTNCN